MSGKLSNSSDVVLGHIPGLNAEISKIIDSIDGDLVIGYLDLMKGIAKGSDLYDTLEHDPVSNGLRKFWSKMATEDLRNVIDSLQGKKISFYSVEKDFYLIKLE